MTSPATTLKDELLEAEGSFWEALRTRNSRRLGELTADSITLVKADGISTLDRDAFVEMMTQGDFRLEAFQLGTGTADVRRLGPGVAVITYGVHGNYRQDGKTHRSDSFNSSTWIDVGGRWMCAWATESLISVAHETASGK